MCRKARRNRRTAGRMVQSLRAGCRQGGGGRGWRVWVTGPGGRGEGLEQAVVFMNPSHGVGVDGVLSGLMALLYRNEPISPGEAVFGSPPPDADAVLAFSSGTTG